MRYLAAVLLLSALASPGWAAADDLADVRRLMEIAPSRSMASPDREALDDYIVRRFRDTGFESGKIVFPTLVFDPGEVALRLPDGETFTLPAMWPNSAFPGNLPKGDWSGPLVDLGNGAPGGTRTGSPAGAAVVLDMKSARAWITALELGAEVLIFAGSERDTNLEAVQKVSAVPLAVPRFYLPFEDARRLRGLLAEKETPTVALTQTRPSRWRRVTAETNWVVIPGGEFADKTVHIQAYKDGASIVPGLTPGAETAANLALLLRLLDHYTTHTPQCTLVFSAASDHCNALRGERFFLASVYPEPDAAEEEVEDLRAELNEATFYETVYGDRSPEQIARLREGTEKFEGTTYILKRPLMRELEYRRNRMLHALGAARETSAEAPNTDDPAQAESEDMLKRRQDLIAMMSILQRWGGNKTFAELTSTQQDRFLSLLGEMETRFREQREDAQAHLDRLAANARLRELLAGKTRHLYLTLDLSFGSDRMGFFYEGSDVIQYYPPEAMDASVAGLARLSVELGSESAEGREFFADTLRNTRGMPWRAYLAGRRLLAATVGSCLSIPSLTLATVHDPLTAAFTPGDTFERLQGGEAARMLAFAESYLPELLEHPDFPKSISEPRKRNYDAMNVRYNLRLVDPFGVELPVEPVADAVTLFYPGHRYVEEMIVGQVCVMHRAMTGRQGDALYRAIPPPGSVEAYGFDAGFTRIAKAIDGGSSQRRVPSHVPGAGTRWVWDDHIGLMFDCVQTDLVGNLQPFTRMQIWSFVLLDAERESSPDHYGFAGAYEGRSDMPPIVALEGIVSVFTEPGTPLKVVTGGYLLINADETEPTGTGYFPGAPQLRQISATATRDVQILNDVRLRRLESKAVSDPAARELYERAETLRQEAVAERTAGRQDAFLSKSVQALGDAMTSYTQVRTTTNDLIRAVAVFLALVAPFCLFFMKLTTPWTDIRAQIVVFVGLFALMATALAFLHPAFELSQTPMMVLLAFVMLGLAVFVMAILYGWFDAGLQDMVARMEGVERTESSRKTLAGVAFNVGVNNMRRRRIRTSLTAATIVLVTFTMLSVISVGSSLEPYRRKTDDAAPYNGVLFARPGFQEIPFTTRDHVSGLLRGRGAVVERTWTQHVYARIYLPMELGLPEDPINTLKVKSLLGLDPEHEPLLDQMPLAAGRRFTATNAAEILLSVSAAKALGIDADDFEPTALELLDRRVTLVGLLEDEALSAATDMVGLPALPLAFFSLWQATTSAQNLQTAATTPAPGAQPLTPAYCGIVPSGFARELPATTVRSIALKADSPAEAFEAGRLLSRVTQSLAYVGLSGPVELDEETTLTAGQYSFGPPTAPKIGGMSKVVIPIFLAATIILNTMLGSVMERRNEIAVYNSIGLNPTHVFVFFVAEAVVFGLIGSVAGYLIGQALAQIIAYAGWLPDNKLNFSSMAVILVILAAMFTVVVSTLYPAYVATRAAVPSGQRRWKLPPPSGDEFWLDFPFSYNREILPGVLSYLRAFLDLNSEASSGKFLAQDLRAGYVPAAEGDRALAMVCQITPVPFDLGVNQRLELYAHYRAELNAYVISACATRLKGERHSWMRVNRGFMESLRARLLSWRSQPAPAQEKFRLAGEALFDAAGDFPVRGAAS